MPRHKKVVQVRPVKDIDAGLNAVAQAYSAQLMQARAEYESLSAALARAATTVDALQGKLRAVNTALSATVFNANI